MWFKVVDEIETDPMVFCDGRWMRRSEMRRLVKEDMERFARLDAGNAIKTAAERQARVAERQALEREHKKAEWKVQWQRQFARWQELNNEAPAEAYAERRALARQRKDEGMVRALLERIEGKQAERRLLKFNLNQKRINDLSDHDYIEWMFACAERGWICPG